MSPKNDLNHNEKNGFQPERVFMISGGHFIHDTFSAFLAPLLPLLIEKLSLTLTMAGSLSASMQFAALLNPLIGRLADKSSARYFVVFAPAATATLMASMGLAPNYYSLLFLLIIAGISVAAFHAPSPAMIARVSGQRIGKGMGWYMAAGEMGRTVGPIFAIWAVTTWTLDGMYRIAVLGWLTTLILFWRLKDISVEKKKGISIREALPTLKAVFIPLTLILTFRIFMHVSTTTFLPVFMTLKGADLWMAENILGFLQGIGILNEGNMASIMENIDLWVSGSALSILEIAGVVGALSVGSISDRVGRKTVLLISASISPLLVIIFLNVNGWVLIPLLLLLGFASLSVGPVFLALIQDHFPEHRAAANGAYMFLAFVTRFPATILVGLVGDYFGLETAFLWSALAAFLVVPVIFMLPPEPKIQAL
ncbi:MAG: MFS transporter [Chloroflexi bacterium]|nr:MFS transporter [Chloroflexota bacterium]